MMQSQGPNLTPFTHNSVVVYFLWDINELDGPGLFLLGQIKMYTIKGTSKIVFVCFFILFFTTVTFTADILNCY